MRFPVSADANQSRLRSAAKAQCGVRAVYNFARLNLRTRRSENSTVTARIVRRLNLFLTQHFRRSIRCWHEWLERVLCYDMVIIAIPRRSTWNIEVLLNQL